MLSVASTRTEPKSSAIIAATGEISGLAGNMDQAALIDLIARVLERLPALGAAFLGGSHGRDEADPYSDVDVYAVVAEAVDIPEMLPRLEQSVDEIAPILFSNVLPNARTINCITMDWLRFDKFFPRARAFAEELDAPWPETFEQVTRKLLKNRIGLDV